MLISSCTKFLSSTWVPVFLFFEWSANTAYRISDLVDSGRKTPLFTGALPNTCLLWCNLGRSPCSQILLHAASSFMDRQKPEKYSIRVGRYSRDHGLTYLFHVFNFEKRVSFHWIFYYATMSSSGLDMMQHSVEIYHDDLDTSPANFVW